MSLIQKLRHVFGPARPTSQPTTPEPPTQVERVLQQQLVTRLQEVFPGLQVARHGDQIVIAPYSLMLDTTVFERTQHPNAVVLGLGFRLIHSQFFPAGIVECLAGLGENDSDAIDSGIQNYLHSGFSTVVEALEGNHNPALNITSATGALWHSTLSPIQVQGAWADRQEHINEHHFFDLLKPQLLRQLTSEALCWLKLYTSKQPSGEIIAECLLNNEPWQEGLALVYQDAEQWPASAAFAGQKQFLVFRRCGSAVLL
ncbi:DUF6348 family protein [Hymenobacter metallicola]|uniref:DUF6348 family protein n=1 Tax=Hymenobacter metallicola TaxID=2563114 RepID=UPI0037427A25